MSSIADNFCAAYFMEHLTAGLAGVTILTQVFIPRPSLRNKDHSFDHSYGQTFLSAWSPRDYYLAL